MLREREGARAPVPGYSEPRRAERSRPDGEKIDTFLYDLTRISKIEILNTETIFSNDIIRPST